jgi:hypothetical protein
MKFEIIAKRDIIRNIIFDELTTASARFNDLSRYYDNSSSGRYGKLAYADEGYGLSLRYNALAEEFDRRYNETTERIDERVFRKAFPKYDE